ncbi:MAG: AAA family ATPase [Methyloprofundus sp.]|nr:AAA family ATPase [Methyloprofundus sp.]
MLSSVSIKNFRNFSDWYDFSLQSKKQYEFNTKSVVNGIINTSIIYGKNGSGKSNLGLAILDLTSHINDIHIMSTLDSNYLSAKVSKDEFAEFKYTFIFDGIEVEYQYGKTDPLTTVYEKLFIDSKLCVEIDRRTNTPATINLEGAESLNKEISGSSISVIKYIKSNAVLNKSNLFNDTFNKFITFVSGMLFFRTLTKTADYHGQMLDIGKLSKAIITADKVDDFEKFLNEAGINCKLSTKEYDSGESIVFIIDGKSINFGLAASTGTMSLGIFYYWWLKLESNQLTFAYIDEFDAYYHYSLSQLIVKKLTGIQCQTVLTTHNLAILSNDLLRPDCYFLMADSLYPFHELVDKDLRKAHNLEKIFKGLTYEY